MIEFHWILAALIHFAPPEQHDSRPWGNEKIEETILRYEGIAETIESTCSNAKDKRSCEALLVAIAVGETGLAKDADLGPCYRKGAFKTRCDSGAAASVWQAHAFGEFEGAPITVKRLFADRRIGAWQALRVARSSLARCRDGAAQDRLSGLSGQCLKGPGPWRARYNLWLAAQGWTPKG